MTDLTSLHRQTGTGRLSLELPTPTPGATAADRTEPVTSSPPVAAGPKDAHDGRGPMQSAACEIKAVDFPTPPAAGESTTETSAPHGLFLKSRLSFDGSGSYSPIRLEGSDYFGLRSTSAANKRLLLPDHLKPPPITTGYYQGATECQSPDPGARWSSYSLFGEGNTAANLLQGLSLSNTLGMGFLGSLNLASTLYGNVGLVGMPTTDATDNKAAELGRVISQMLAQTAFVQNGPPGDPAVQAYNELSAALHFHRAAPSNDTEAALYREMVEFVAAINTLKLGDLGAAPQAGSREAAHLQGITENFATRFHTIGSIRDDQIDAHPELRNLLDSLGCTTILEMQRKLGLKEDGIFGPRTYFQAQLHSFATLAEGLAVEKEAQQEVLKKASRTQNYANSLRQIDNDGSGFQELIQTGDLSRGLQMSLRAQGYEFADGKIMQNGSEITDPATIKQIGRDLVAESANHIESRLAALYQERDRIQASGAGAVLQQGNDHLMSQIADLEAYLEYRRTGTLPEDQDTRVGVFTVTMQIHMGPEDAAETLTRFTSEEGISLSEVASNSSIKAALDEFKAAGMELIYDEEKGTVRIADPNGAFAARIETMTAIHTQPEFATFAQILTETFELYKDLETLIDVFQLSPADVTQAFNLNQPVFDTVAELKDATKKLQAIQHVFEEIADELRAQREAMEDAPVERETFIEKTPTFHQLPPLDPPGHRAKGLGGKSDDQFDLSALIERQAAYLRNWDDQLQQEYADAIAARSLQRTQERREALQVVTSSEVLDASGNRIEVSTTADGRMHIG